MKNPLLYIFHFKTSYTVGKDLTSINLSTSLEIRYSDQYGYIHKERERLDTDHDYNVPGTVRKFQTKMII